jgi:hypothetical protein
MGAARRRSRESAAAERKLQDARREAAHLVDAVAKGEMTGHMVSAAQLGRRRHRSAHRQYGKVWICASFRTSAAQRGCGLRMPASGKLHMSEPEIPGSPSATVPKRRPARRPRWGSLSHVGEGPVWRSSSGLGYRIDPNHDTTQPSACNRRDPLARAGCGQRAQKSMPSLFLSRSPRHCELSLPLL